MITLKNRRPNILVLCFLISLVITGCDCKVSQGTETYLPTSGRGPIHKIQTSQYGTAEIPDTDTIELVFPCIPEPPELTPGLESRIGGRSVYLWFKADASANSKTSRRAAGPLQARFPISNYTLNLSRSINRQVQVLAGDANNDGKIDMLDVYPIAEGIRKFAGNPIPNFASPINNPIGNTTYARPKTDSTWTWNLQPTTVDFVHADCNMDGRINEADLNFIKPLLTPMKLDTMLRGGISGLKLTANVSNNFQVEVYNNTAQSRHEIRAWYDIRFDVSALPGKILGVAFTRPVAEDPGIYEVLHIQASTQYSRVFATPSDMLGHQHYWDNLHIQMPDECPGHSGVSHLLDVGVFNIQDPFHPTSGDCIISCGVTIDDMLRTAGTGQVRNIFQHLMNVVIFTTNAQGGVTVVTAECDFDALDLSKADVTIHPKGELPSDWWMAEEGRGKESM